LQLIVPAFKENRLRLDELLARIRTGLRRLNIHLALETRVHDLETRIVETKKAELQRPL
jgi:hypothetical protein